MAVAITGIGLDAMRLQRDCQFIGARQVAEIVESERFQKERRGPVQQRTTQRFAAPDNLDQAAAIIGGRAYIA